MTQTQFAQINEASIGFDVTGTGFPIVLLHAGIGDRRMWDDQVLALAESFTVIRCDARGFGETRELRKPPAAYFAYGDVIGLLNHLGFGRAHLVGVSMGAHTALDTAVAAPERVSALVVVAARMGVPPSNSLRAGWKAVDELVEAGDIDGANEYELRMWVDGPNRGPDAVPREVRERVRAMNRALLTRDDTEDNEQKPDPPTEDCLARIACPTMIIWGDQDVPDVISAGSRLAATIPGARRAIIPDTAHLPHMEKPEEFNRAVLKFLASVPVD